MNLKKIFKSKKFGPMLIGIIFVISTFAFIVPYLSTGNKVYLEIDYGYKPIKGNIVVEKDQSLLEALSKYLNLKIENNTIQCIQVPMGASYYYLCNENNTKWHVYLIRDGAIKEINDIAKFYPKGGDQIIIKYD